MSRLFQFLLDFLTIDYIAVLYLEQIYYNIIFHDYTSYINLIPPMSMSLDGFLLMPVFSEICNVIQQHGPQYVPFGALDIHRIYTYKGQGNPKLRLLITCEPQSIPMVWPSIHRAYQHALLLCLEIGHGLPCCRRAFG